MNVIFLAFGTSIPDAVASEVAGAPPSKRQETTRWSEPAAGVGVQALLRLRLGEGGVEWRGWAVGGAASRGGAPGQGGGGNQGREQAGAVERRTVGEKDPRANTVTSARAMIKGVG
jgi:hypothetical protein